MTRGETRSEASAWAALGPVLDAAEQAGKPVLVHPGPEAPDPLVHVDTSSYGSGSLVSRRRQSLLLNQRRTPGG